LFRWAKRPSFSFVGVLVVEQDPTMKEFGLVIEIKKTQILNLVEVLHLET